MVIYKLNTKSKRITFVRVIMYIVICFLFFNIVFSTVSVLYFNKPTTTSDTNSPIDIVAGANVVFAKILGNNKYEFNSFGIASIITYSVGMILGIIGISFYLSSKYSFGKSKYLLLNSIILIMLFATVTFLFGILLTPIINGRVWYEANIVPRNIYFTLLDIKYDASNSLINKNGLTFGWYKVDNITIGKDLSPGSLYYTFMGYGVTIICLSLFVWISLVLKLLNPAYNSKNESAISYKEKDLNEVIKK
ncbi:hypothetical protein [Malacoplasma iowae]|uniref:Uncharacterized protein n=1 Tax=Malacoplasma iowae 695 TaxID=1048830 RepID=A0A6P1LGC9_MALIO|nr:hypothetical protein [Malacoplasma iowae]VEU63421.1 Uncharacterised protein [Mycoplasmopsis fermentans]EGZ31509.1 hypothetical protein GUU_01777 [Malacoplasma iowae 695]QHG89670.1 hypothetical protein EER00_02030 [Malacoplasma iowae 695]WPL35541.1 hypothetical protein QX180_04415 [Malacoplasma iowae]WPL39071.1 hypothetical protein QX181_00845 [Malacoplasma iowae]